MRMLRRISFWALALLFAAGTIFWSLYIPHRPLDLYRAIPAQATFVSAHHNLAGRWGDLATNPVTRSLLLSLGFDEDDLDSAADGADAGPWLKRLAGQETLFAYVPRLGPAGETAWVFASWLGSGSQRLRWMLYWSKGKGIKHAFDRAGHHIWMVDPRVSKSADVISFAFVEGMVIGTISKRAATTASVLDCFDGTYPSFFRTRNPDLMPLPDTNTPDRGWFTWREKSGIYSAPRGFFDIHHLGPNSINADVELPWTKGELAKDAEPAVAHDDLEACWKDGPVAVAFLRSGLLQRLAGDSRMTLPRETLGLATDVGAGEIALAAMAGDLSGRFKGIKMPTILAAVPVEGDAAPETNVVARMDALNAMNRWGLVPQELVVGSQRVYAVESTADTPYARSPKDELLAYTVSGSWLVFASNVEGLTNLLARPAPAGAREWNVQNGGDDASLWLDLDDGAKAFRVAITAYALKLAAEDAEKSQPMRQRLNEAKAWIDAIAPMKSLRATVRVKTDRIAVHLDAGAVNRSDGP